jgi:steroid 5-alpha reductase family enzyme
MSPFLLSLGALAVLCALFALLYALARGIDNYGIVDIAWSYSFGVLALIYCLFGGGWPARRALIGAMVASWSLRLGTHLLVRIAKKHPEEDGRYRQLRKAWGASFPLKMAGFFQVQAASVVLLGLPFLVASTDPRPAFRPLEWCGSAAWLFAISGEALADTQLSMFKSNPKNAGLVCDIGLWRYSRHPNYFFEWLIWVSYFVFSCARRGDASGLSARHACSTFCCA